MHAESVVFVKIWGGQVCKKQYLYEWVMTILRKKKVEIIVSSFIHTWVFLGTLEVYWCYFETPLKVGMTAIIKYSKNFLMKLFFIYIKLIKGSTVFGWNMKKIRNVTKIFWNMTSFSPQENGSNMRAHLLSLCAV